MFNSWAATLSKIKKILRCYACMNYFCFEFYFLFYQSILCEIHILCNKWYVYFFDNRQYNPTSVCITQTWVHKFFKPLRLGEVPNDTCIWYIHFKKKKCIWYIKYFFSSRNFFYLFAHLSLVCNSHFSIKALRTAL